MAAGDVIDGIYGRATSFGRDVFHYVLTGTVFVLVSSVPLWPVFREPVASNLKLLIDSAGIEVVALFVALIVLYCIGHVLLSVGFCIRKCWKRLFCCSKHVREYREAISRIENLEVGETQSDDERDVHLPVEITVFIHKPDLHARFVERYNTLWHLRLGMATALLCAGAVGSAIGFCWGNCRVLTVCVAVGAISGGLVLMRQHLVTNTSFLNRVLAGYQIVQREARKSGTQPQ